MVFSAPQDSIYKGRLNSGVKVAIGCHELCPLPTHEVRAMGLKLLGTLGSVLAASSASLPSSEVSSGIVDGCTLSPAVVGSV